MNEQTLRVTIVASLGQFRAQMGAAAADVKAFGKTVGDATGKAATGFQSAGRGAVLFGAAVATGFGAAAAAAMSFESSFAGVRKTVDGTDAELTAIRDGIRELSREMPSSANEISKVAAAAGALGVATPDVLRFSEVMVKLGEATDDLPADTAAVVMARLMNVMQTAPGDVERVASALVDLGNNGASTEGQIVEMATRIASAGRQVGLTEADVLGLANALSSVGQEAEAGGSAMSRTIIEMQNAVMDGGAALDTFASTADMSASRFAETFRTDAAGAVIAFVEGLRSLGDQGANTNAILEDLGLNDIRVGNALRSLAGGGDLLRESLERGSRAFTENAALTDEYERRLETTAAQLEILKNNLVDMAISAGEVVLPALRSLAEAGVDFLDFVRGLPGPVKAVAVALTGFAGVVGLVGGAAVLAVPKVVAFRTALGEVGKRSPGVATGLGFAARGMGLVAGAGAAVVTVWSLVQAFRALGGTIDDQLRKAFKELAVSADENLLAAFNNASDRMEFFNRLLEESPGAAMRLRDAWERTGRDIDAVLVESGLPTFLESMDEALAATAEKMGRADADAARAAAAFGGLTAGVEDGTDALDDFGDRLDALHNRAFGVSDAVGRFRSDLLDFADTIRAAQAGGEGFATALDSASIEGIRNQQVISDLVRGAFDVAEALKAAGVEPAPAMAMLRDELEWTLVQLGFNEAKVKDYLAVLGKIADIGSLNTAVTVDISQAQAALQKLLGLFAQVGQMGRDVRARIEVGGGAMGVVGEALAALPNLTSSTAATGLADVLAGRGPATTRAVTGLSGGGGGASGLSPAEEQERARPLHAPTWDALFEGISS